MRRATRSEIGAWDELVRANPDGGHMLQTRAWGELKRRWGWHPEYMVAEGSSGPVAILLLRRRVPGLGSLLYAPKGPGVVSTGDLDRVLSGRDGLGDAFCVEVEPELPDTPVARAALTAMGLRKGEDVQIARATLVVDLTPSEDALLASFRPKTRYNIRLAARRGVTVSVEPCEDGAVRAMHRLMAAASDRAAFPLRPLPYYATYWRLFEASGQGALLLARLGDEVLAGAYVAWLGGRAWYKDGGSSLRHRELMAPHLVQWEAMRHLRSRGVTEYDLFAVPGRAEQRDPASPLRGLWQFKSGFSGELREFVGLWDLVLDARRQAIWRRVVEPVVRRARWRLRGDLLY